MAQRGVKAEPSPAVSGSIRTHRRPDRPGLPGPYTRGPFTPQRSWTRFTSTSTG